MRKTSKPPATIPSEGDVTPAPRLPLAPGVRPTAEDLQWLDRVLEAIEDDGAEETFSVQALADRLAVHRSRLHERLRHLTGLPPVRLILRWRLQRAAALLEKGSASVSQAAYDAGFQNVEHFSRSFRKHYGQTPSAYRRGEAESAPTINQELATKDQTAAPGARVKSGQKSE